jgi:hypothetical protein
MLVAVLMVVSLSLQPAQVQGAAAKKTSGVAAKKTSGAAAKKISVYVDGVKLNPLQAPTMIKGRTMLPMRAIFEAFNAQILWNQQTKTVTAIRNDIKVVLKVGSKTATVNNQSVALDVPAQLLSGTTMVPVRFVSETLGAEVYWNQQTQTVNIVTSKPVPTNPIPTSPVNAVSYVTLQNVGRNGDGRDLQVSFPKVDRESDVSEYRVLIVKSSNSYGLTLSQAISNRNYTSVRPSGINQVVNLASQTRDVNGDVLNANQSYNAYVITVGRNGANALSGMSQSVTLTTNTSSVSVVSNVNVSTVNNYGDGRDLSVSFYQPQNTSNIQNYRVMVVKTKDASSFNLNVANALSSSNYTTVNKTNSTTVTTTLNSSTRDTSGEYIRTGVSYYVYVLSVNSSSNVSSQLSSGSSSFTLGSNNAFAAPVITRVENVSSYGDGRDLMVRFSRSSDESRIGSYRIFVVKDSKASSFNLSTATSVSSSNYYSVNKTGYDINQTLTYGSRDVDGSVLVPGVAYRVFVMAVGTGSYSGSYSLSGVSSYIALYRNGNGNGNGNGSGNVNAASSVGVSTVSNYGDSRDLRVSFTRAYDESNLSGYRIMVVKSGDADYFNLSKASSLSSYYYTDVYKTGYNITTTLPGGARSVDGELIRNGVSYKVFVLSVGPYGNNALSYSSSAISLSNNNASVYPATDVAVSLASNYGDGRDLRVSFKPASNESNLNGYRIMVVKSGNVNNFNLSRANGLSPSYYTSVNKTGYNFSQILAQGARDVDGDLIQSGIKYRVVVLSVGAYGNNTLSSYSGEINLSNNASVDKVTSISVTQVPNNGNYSDLTVSFNRVNESNLFEYRIFVTENNSFTLAQAEGLTSSYTSVSKSSSSASVKLSSGAVVGGGSIETGKAYYVYVMSVGTNGYKNNLSVASSSSKFTLTKKDVAKVSGIELQVFGTNGDGRDLQVSFKPVPSPNNNNIQEYRIIIVPFGKTADPSATNYTPVTKTTSFVNQQLKEDTKDIYNQVIKGGQSYQAYVLSVGTDGTNALAGPSKEVTVPNKPVENVGAASNVNAEVTGSRSKASDIKVTFDKANNEKDIDQYRIILVKNGNLTKDNAINLTSNYTPVQKKSNGQYGIILSDNATDNEGSPIDNKNSYKVYVLSVGIKSNGTYELTSTQNEVQLVAPGTPVTAVGDLKTETTDDRGPQVSFARLTDETGIQEYRIFFVPGTTEFKEENALGLDKPKYTQVSPSSNKSYQKTLTSNMVGTDGAGLTKEKSYKVYVLSVAENDTTKNSKLSIPADLQLTSDLAEARKIAANWNNGQIEVNFKPAVDESKVQRYAVVVAPTNTDPKNFATNIGSNKNVKTPVKSNGQYAVTFSDKDQDISGNKLIVDQSYNVYVVSIAKNANDANVWSASVPASKAEDTNKEKNNQQTP